MVLLGLGLCLLQMLNSVNYCSKVLFPEQQRKGKVIVHSFIFEIEYVYAAQAVLELL